MSKLPLAGVKVIEFSVGHAGPQCGEILADLGAEVIKVESPKGGDHTRGFSKVGNLSTYYGAYNRNKKDIAVDVKTPEGREVVLKLARSSDAFLQNLEPGRLREFGLSFEDVKKANPRIVYCSIIPYGKSGPLAKEAGFDICFQAMSGLMTRQVLPDGTPQWVGLGVIDAYTGALAAYSIMAGLWARNRTRKAQNVDVCLFDSALFLQARQFAHLLNLHEDPPRQDSGAPPLGPLWRTFRAKDGGFVTIGGVRDDRWPGFCRALGLQRIQNDPRFNTSDNRTLNRAELIPIVNAAFLKHTRDEWLPILKESKVINAPVYSYAEVVEQPLMAEQLRENGSLVTSPGSNFRTMALPIKFEAAPAKPYDLPPDLGQHTEQTLVELGYSWDEIVKLKDKQVII